ncbi:pectate lyase [Actinomadura craniellae]|uniref:pectate lyase n=1 Tax=Actinomadura craniellae TaxID=2231787 RepID=A0A365H8I8_9ACTN|nr:pectate lyase [Actinomadura craniellae]RAY15391.1 pectate lyase [Actinomadura craniellae]
MRRSLIAVAALGATVLGGGGLAASAGAAAAPEGTYTLVNAGSGLCLDVLSYSQEENAQLIQWNCHGDVNQQFRVSGSGTGQTLTAVHSGKVAGVRAKSLSGNVQIQQQTPTGEAHQRWELRSLGGSDYHLVNNRSGKCATIQGNSTAPAAIVQQNTCDGSRAKVWTLRPVSGGPPPTEPPPTNPPPGSWPAPRGQQAVGATIAVSGSYDGGLRRFYGTGDLGDGGQNEGQDPIFRLADGAVLRNVILGAPAADGIHCAGSCTLQNVWWEDVGEDAATFRSSSSSATFLVDGGGARKAGDKVFQHNGAGTLTVRNFQAQDFGKLYRSCGNCSTQYRRNLVLQNITVTAPGKALAGVNTNYGDTARFSGITIVGDSSRKIVICERYTGNSSGDEPVKTGTGADGRHCLYGTSDITYR